MLSEADLRTHRALMIEAPPQLTLDGTVRYRPGWALGVPNLTGVYLIHDLRGTLYIGSATELRRRYEDHYLDSHNPSLRRALRSAVGPISFSWVLVAAPDHLEFERLLIRSFRPLCNVQHNAQ